MVNKSVKKHYTFLSFVGHHLYSGLLCVFTDEVNNRVSPEVSNFLSSCSTGLTF